MFPARSLPSFPWKPRLGDCVFPTANSSTIFRINAGTSDGLPVTKPLTTPTSFIDAGRTVLQVGLDRRPGRQGAITREPEHPPAPVVPGQSPPRVRVPERNGELIPGRLRHLDLFKENLPPELPLFSSRFFACRVRQRARRVRPDDPALTARSRSDCDRPPPG